MDTQQKSLFECWFKLSENHTNVRTEILAGFTTFLTMCYIIIVNPSVLSLTGMDFGAVFAATCISSAIGCFIMGALANYPIALAPGMGLNAYFTFSVVKGMGVPWQVALAAVFVSGCIFIVFSTFKVREMLVNALPMSLKMAIASGIGLFLALIALKGSGVVVANEATLLTMGDFFVIKDGVKSVNFPVVLALSGLFLTITLDYYHIRGAIIISIFTITLCAWRLGLTEITHVADSIPSLQPTFMQMDFNGLFQGGMVAAIFVFFLVDLFDSTGTLVGVTHRAGLLDEKGHLPRLKNALFADSIAIVVGAGLGTSSTTPYIESASGVAAGGRTGLTAITVGVLMLACLWLSPLAKAVPSFATAPALLYIGVQMMRSAIEIDWKDITEAAPAFLTIAFMPFTYSIADGIAIGFISYAAIKLLCNRAKDVPVMVWFVALAWLAKFWFLGA
ncbi:NCS2 family permease [Kingella negevensis]|uniref:Putative adenine permease PurP n=1 Tax=Kingella negevensis TaxID=1522312 RepID=A0A238TB37_9NEIS|nr:NCS2 family permease [Kingella negevensis]MDK4679516.1 NCS2 family permease [Kingella negevensis]MDK4682766.1 NCS2 family permease [Kingella negevensis]MDK4685082.1 NCS2 family permease [Kingella negevensis]MDK4690963.1 NCS2 family permease [Kingella negevensis]MDK4693890.1 NCS2 family permease [Kingella negevensis]